MEKDFSSEKMLNELNKFKICTNDVSSLVIQDHYLEEIKIVEIEVIGDYPDTLKDASQLYDHITSLCRYYKVNRVLCDFRNIIYQVPYSQIFKDCQHWFNFDLRYLPNYFAYILEANSTSLKNFKLLMSLLDINVLFKKPEYKYQIFEDYEQGISWLSQYNH